MASNNDLNALLAQVPVGDLAEKFGVDGATVKAAVRQALPGLVGGMAVNASDQTGEAKLQAAVQKHQPGGGAPTLKAIDAEDGQKIVKHVLGDKKDDVALALGANAGNSAVADLIPKLLPLLAPLVMQFLAGKIGGTSGGATSGGGLGGVLGDLLGGLLGGANGGAKPSTKDQAGPSGGDLGDLLGGLLGGGGQGSGGGGGLGGLLGGLLGK